MKLRPKKTAETIESQTPSVSLFAELLNYAENQRVVTEMSMLDEVAAEAARLAEAQTQPNGRDADAENMEINSSTQAAGHCVKRLA